MSEDRRSRAPGRPLHFSLRLAVLALLLPGLSACSFVSEPNPTPTASPLPTATPTPQVTFLVAVTPPVIRRRVRPTATPTRFVRPKNAFLILHPSSGPPISRTISITGGNFPDDVEVTLNWSPSRRVTPLSTTAYSDRRGNVGGSLSIPASAPGLYQVVAEVDGMRYAMARYRIVSRAVLSASVVPGGNGGTIRVAGRKFIEGYQLTLIAYSLVGGRQPIVIGTVKADRHGSFLFVGPAKRLQPGQYVLRAWSLSTVAAQMAQTYFEVVV